MRCHYTYDEVAGRVLIPGCMGAAVHGMIGCTCGPKIQYRGSNDSARVVELEREVNRLQREISRLKRKSIW